MQKFSIGGVGGKSAVVYSVSAELEVMMNEVVHSVSAELQVRLVYLHFTIHTYKYYVSFIMNQIMSG